MPDQMTIYKEEHGPMIKKHCMRMLVMLAIFLVPVTSNGIEITAPEVLAEELVKTGHEYTAYFVTNARQYFSLQLKR